MINEIKIRGFEKYKQEIDERIKIKNHYEILVQSLQKKVNFVNSQKKHFGTKNSKIEAEMGLYKGLSDRFKRDLFFMHKEIPQIKKELPNV